jgi:hypothetical protein
VIYYVWVVVLVFLGVSFYVMAEGAAEKRHPHRPGALWRTAALAWVWLRHPVWTWQLHARAPSVITPPRDPRDTAVTTRRPEGP